MIRLAWWSDGEEATLRFGRVLGRSLLAPAWLGLQGPLGAGKTRLVQGIAEGVGYAGRVRSPTFVLENRYRGARCLLRHLDLYRLDEPGEELELSWEEDSSGLVVVEWAERVARPPGGAVAIQIDPVEETGRWIRMVWAGGHPIGDFRFEQLGRHGG